jgi:hypothetical protein
MKSLSAQIISDGKFSGIFPGWGESRVVAVRYESSEGMTVVGDTAKKDYEFERVSPKSHGKLHAPGEGLSTAFSVSIAGCDLMGSCLYTAGVCAFNSGKVSYCFSS